MPKYHSLRGMSDIQGDEAFLHHWVEENARKVFSIFGFTEIRTPILEETEVFTRSIGEETDIVQKEMYSFPDRGGKSISLRPEGTASIIRAYIEHNLSANRDITKLFYIGPMFRGERPQKGRLRQFHQIGAEIIGATGACVDAELILNIRHVLESIHVRSFSINLNSLGCAKDRDAYKKKLKLFLNEKKESLCEDCRRRVDTNILRVLDCKVEACGKVIEKAPVILDFICDECAQDYKKLKELLTKLGVDYKENPRMVRGLDYYTKTIFEVSHPALGAQDAIAAGGRYDDLTREMGGPDVGAIGYAIGIERALLAVSKEKVVPAPPGVLVVTLDDALQVEGMKLAEKLRQEGIACEVDHSGRSLKGGLRKANREKRKKVLILGEDEMKKGEILLKDMETGEQKSLGVEDVIKELR